MKFFVLPALAAAALSGANARPARSTSRLSPSTAPPPPEDYHPPPTTSTSTSEASCKAEVRATTESEAKSAMLDAYKEVIADQCWPWRQDKSATDTKTASISAIAKLVLESKLDCSASGKYAYACGGTWSKATSYAGAAFEAYASAWATAKEDCGCELELISQSDVSVSAWGEIWNKIWASLDHYGCVSSGDTGYYSTYDDALKETKKVECTATLIYDIVAEATAGAWRKSNCKLWPSGPAECEIACCEEDAAGAYVLNCNDKCKKACFEATWAEAETKAEARITFSKNTDIKTCTGTLTDHLNYCDTEFAVNMGQWKYVDDECAETEATCESFTKGDALAFAVSDTASRSKHLTKSLCKVPYNLDKIGYQTIYNEAEGIALAIAQVYNKATAECSIEGNCLDPFYDGGCAYSKSWVEAAASATAEAVAQASATIKFGTKADDDCDCNLGGAAFSVAIAHEVENIHATAVSTVEAEACTEGVVKSEVATTCFAKSYAELYAKAFAKVLLENNCIKADKAEYCEGKCKEYETYDEEWKPCIAECEGHADAEASAFASALAEIKLTTDEYCKTHEAWGSVQYDFDTSTTEPI